MSYEYMGLTFKDRHDLAEGVFEYWLSENGSNDINDVLTIIEEEEYDILVERLLDSIECPSVLDDDDLSSAIERYHTRLKDLEEDETLPFGF